MFIFIYEGTSYKVPTEGFNDRYPPFSIRRIESPKDAKIVVFIYDWNLDGTDYSWNGDWIGFHMDGKRVWSRPRIIDPP